MLEKNSKLSSLFQSTLSRLKRTGAMEIFPPPVGNEGAGNKGVALCGVVDFAQNANNENSF